MMLCLRNSWWCSNNDNNKVFLYIPEHFCENCSRAKVKARVSSRLTCDASTLTLTGPTTRVIVFISVKVLTCFPSLSHL